MPRSSPDHNGLRVIAEVATSAAPGGEHPDERAFFYLVKDGVAPPAMGHVRDAYEIYREPDFAHPINAMVLGGASHDDVFGALRVPHHVGQAYRHLFFDLDVFRHAMDVRQYVRRLDVDPDVRALYVTAIEQGPEFLANRLRVGARTKVDARDVVKGVMADMYDRFQAHRGQALTSELAKEALRWGQGAVTTAAVVIDKGGEEKRNALAELTLALKVVDHTVTPEAVGINPKDVLS